MKQEKHENISTFKKYIHIIIITSVMIGLSFLSLTFCHWWGCYNISLINFLHGDLICNICTHMSYDLQKYQMTLYGSMFTFFTYQFNNLIKKVSPDNIHQIPSLFERSENENK